MSTVLNEIKNKNLYDLKNLLFKAVIENDEKTEKEVKKEIKNRINKPLWDYFNK